MGQVTQQTIQTPPTGPNAPATPPANTERPAWLPEKFKTPEDFAKSYAELETKLGSQGQQQQPPAADPKAGQQPTTPPATPPADDKGKQPPAADLSKFEQEFTTTGKLSDASFSELEKLGYPKATVESYIAGQQARANQLAQEVFTAVGGQDTLKQMMTWAEGNFNEAEQKAFNDAMMSGDSAKMKLAATSLQARYTSAYGKAPTLIGGKAGVAGPTPFSNWAQVTEAMANPKYANDAAYRADVEKRIAASSL
jgi:hypothetical protein